MFKEVSSAVIVNGTPLIKLKIVFTCQPPKMAEAAPPLFNQCFPLPKGSCQTLVTAKVCVRSKPVCDRLRYEYCRAWILSMSLSGVALLSVKLIALPQV